MDIQMKEVYNHLEDDLSRKIFENRLLYSSDKNFEFIDNVISLSFPDLENTKNKLKDMFNGCDVIIYGAGFLGRQLSLLCDKIKITAFCDGNKGKQNTKILGHNVISPEQLAEKYISSTVIISVLTYGDIKDISNNLLNFGFSKRQIFVFQDLFEKFDFKYKPFRQYFDADIILPQISEDEIFIDGGCFNCATSAQFAEYCGNKYKKIIAFEPNSKQYNVCVKKSKTIRDITLHPYGLWDKKTVLDFDLDRSPESAHITNEINENTVRIEMVKLDDMLNGERATFIKMDIEGAELAALKGAEQTILRYHPKLAICVYHKPDDIWEIPSYILSIHNDYKLYLRHYSLKNGETVLYAV